MFQSWIRRWRVTLSFLIGVVILLLSNPSYSSIGWGLPFVILGESLRTWSSGHIRKNKKLATDGPYAYTRNPLYLGSFLLGFGFVMMGINLYLMIVFLAGYIMVYHAVVWSEEVDLEKTFGREFRDYRDRVPRFFPRFQREPYEAGLFEWGLVQRHREYHAWLGILGVLIFFLLKAGG